jgi:hypothetical protein
MNILKTFLSLKIFQGEIQVLSLEWVLVLVAFTALYQASHNPQIY